MDSLAEQRQRELDALADRPQYGTSSAPRRWPGRERREPSRVVVRPATEEDRAGWPCWLAEVDAECAARGLARVKAMEVKGEEPSTI